MFEPNPEDEIFVPQARVCLTVMNGKTDMLVKNPRFSKGYEDLSQ